ncbi:MAG TPA: HutD family protein [Steroidobacteraceae bacterium]|nr:HutD family protein [Steroidobacteraceae bacterium]
MTSHVKGGSGLRVRKYEAYRHMPWRNGLGSTLEIAREPATGEDFAWRLSLADIDRDCEFSAYPGYRRALVLVAGARLQLRFRGHGDCLLDAARRGTRFEGEWKTHCAIADGRCTDLSLIVRRGPAARPASVVRAPRMLRVGPTACVVLAADLYGALFVLEGSVSIGESVRARARNLGTGDTLLLSPGRQRTLRLRSLEPSMARLVLLRWRPGRAR